jgi:hypothetical protein
VDSIIVWVLIHIVMIVAAPASAGLQNAFFSAMLNAMEYHPTGAVHMWVFRYSEFQKTAS